MKILLIFLSSLFLIVNSHPYIVSIFPSSTIVNFRDDSIRVMVKFSEPIVIYLDNQYIPIQSLDNSTLNNWFIGKQAILLKSGDWYTLPDYLSFSDQSLILLFSTPIDKSEFILFINEFTFFNTFHDPCPPTSPMVISRLPVNSFEYNPEIPNFETYKYNVSQTEYIFNFSVDQRSIIFGESNIKIELAINSSGSGITKFNNQSINLNGFKYFFDLQIEIFNNGPLYSVLLNNIGEITSFSEETRIGGKNLDGDTILSSRSSLFIDIERVKNGILYYNRPIFYNFQFEDIAGNLELEDFLHLKFTRLNTDIIEIEYFWNKSEGSWKSIPFENRGFNCGLNSNRNQFCKMCQSINHRIHRDKDYTQYLINQPSLIESGIAVSVSSDVNKIPFKFETIMDPINFPNYSLFIPQISPNPSYFVWINESYPENCKDISLSYLEFFSNASCSQPQYSCTNSKIFNNPQISTLSINSLFNDIIFMDNSIQFRKQHQLIIFNVIIETKNLVFMEPQIDARDFLKENETHIIYTTTIQNIGNIDGIFLFNIGSNITYHNTSGYQNIPKNSLYEIEHSMLKQKGSKNLYIYCYSEIKISEQPNWSPVNKVKTLSKTFTTFNGNLKENCVNGNLYRPETPTLDNMIKSKGILQTNSFFTGNQAYIFINITCLSTTFSTFKISLNCSEGISTIYKPELDFQGFGSSIHPIYLEKKIGGNRGSCDIKIHQCWKGLGDRWEFFFSDNNFI
ncbi:hypothetical protein DLAC_07480 [Tieghemostelium lacteum]|uniref:CARDB domain-containing protein n=1 Tax=Tieghemostelium lacteum TaxID=361077 RepID=A0A151ZCN6_TIELA|nr:hypothetical protein DLAC_07480 [Tieghemostelium lacteum]|eukprot:KYQ91699.1 hypothetical protein DLAC_07480 [Tieghemostelium lacteum]